MKRTLKTIVLLLTLAALLSIFAGCFSGSGKKEPTIAYGKKYVSARELLASGTERYFVFESDGTGYRYVRATYSETSTIFIWRISGDGKVYMFPTNDEDSNYTSDAFFGSVSFETEFLVFDTGSGVSLYVLEGSDLEQAIKGD